uniref:PilZ domain-containing protein n=1 Tax=Agathobacter sp. TaxID=2021311 RepID=UPI00405684A0
MQEKRRDKRHELHVNLVLKPITNTQDNNMLDLDVEVTDASHGGIGFISHEYMEVGTYYDAQLQIWSKAVIETILEIVRRVQLADGSYNYGAKFIGMNDKDAIKIDIYDMFEDARANKKE